jgi:hypothetical protein
MTDKLGRRSGPRRKYSVAEKRSMVEETRQPGASVPEVAQRHGEIAAKFLREVDGDTGMHAALTVQELGAVIERHERPMPLWSVAPLAAFFTNASPASLTHRLKPSLSTLSDRATSPRCGSSVHNTSPST